MKKVLSVLLVTLVLAGCLFTLGISAEEEEFDLSQFDQEYYSRFKNDNITLYVYNWGEYISDGSEDSLDVLKVFEDLTGIRVNYTTFDSNENMYSKIKSESAYYDIVIPSDYMVSRLIKEGKLAKLNYDNIPNAQYIDERFTGENCEFDPNNVHSIPYTWGMLGIIYNTKYVDEADVGSWDLLWNEKYKGKILMIDNSRDAFAIAEKLLGYSMNTENPDEIAKAAEKLEAQKPLLQSYVMDQVFNKMEQENAWIAPYYVGDFLTMVEKNENLEFSVPEEGTNLFTDAMCVLERSQNKEAAEMFLNFMCEPVISAENLSFIGYSTPMTAARELMDEEVANDPYAYPPAEVVANTEIYVNLSDKANQLLDDYWIKNIRVNSLSAAFWIVVAVVAVAIVVVVLVVVTNKKKKMAARNEAE